MMHNLISEGPEYRTTTGRSMMRRVVTLVWVSGVGAVKLSDCVIPT